MEPLGMLSFTPLVWVTFRVLVGLSGRVGAQRFVPAKDFISCHGKFYEAYFIFRPANFSEISVKFDYFSPFPTFLFCRRSRGGTADMIQAALMLRYGGRVTSH